MGYRVPGCSRLCHNFPLPSLERQGVFCTGARKLKFLCGKLRIALMPNVNLTDGQKEANTNIQSLWGRGVTMPLPTTLFHIQKRFL